MAFFKAQKKFQNDGSVKQEKTNERWAISYWYKEQTVLVGRRGVRRREQEGLHKSGKLSS